MQEFSRSLPMMLYRALDAVMPRFRRIFSEFGLTEQQWRVLRVLWEHDAIAFRELSRITLIPAPSLVGVIDRLARGGLAERRRSQADRRHVYVRATAEGHALEKKVRPRVDAAYAELKASVSPESWEAVIAGLDTISSVGDATRQAVNQ